MFRTAVLLLALSSPVALADTGTEDTGTAEDTGAAEDTGEAEDTVSGGTEDSGGADGSNTQTPDILDDGDQNTGTAGSPADLPGVDTGCSGSGSMALLALPLLFGWRLRRS